MEKPPNYAYPVFGRTLDALIGDRVIVLAKFVTRESPAFHSLQRDGYGINNSQLNGGKSND